MVPTAVAESQGALGTPLGWWVGLALARRLEAPTCPVITDLGIVISLRLSQSWNRRQNSRIDDTSQS